MTRNQAVALAERLTSEGLKQADIAIKLAEAGYVSSKTGKPVHQSVICQMLRVKKRRNKRKDRTPAARPEAAKPTMKRGSLDAIKSILKLKGMAAKERIALALLVLE